MSCDLVVVTISVIAIAFITMWIVGYNYERKLWNGGVCAKNGISWKSFDMDSQGGRGYTAGNQYIWISYPVDKQYTRDYSK